MVANSIDCATQLDGTKLQSLGNYFKNTLESKLEYISRYLGVHSWKGLTLQEVESIVKQGYKIISFYEKNPTHDYYFTEKRALQDLDDAVKNAEDVHQPHGTCIVFTVDEDAGDLEAVATYFKTIKENMKDYLVGAYGSYEIMKLLYDRGLADFFYQTYAWSGGKEFEHNHAYQFHNGVRIGGFSVDLDYVSDGDIAWTLGDHKKIQEPHYRADQHRESKIPVMYTVHPGDTVWDIEVHKHLKHGTIENLNPKLKNPSKIYPGQKLTVGYRTIHRSSSTLKFSRYLELRRPYMEGHDVELVQRALNIAVGRHLVNVDGVYGPKTEHAVKDYQHRHGLKVDGIVGPVTWNTLF